MSAPIITKAMFWRYEMVRRSGKYNIWFPQARIATGLDKDAYLEIIAHFEQYALMYRDTDEAWDKLV